MAFVHGKNSTFSINDVSDTTRDLSGAVDSCSLSQDVEMAETTTFADDAKTYIVGLKDGTFSVSGHFTAADNSADVVLSGLLGFDTARGVVYAPDGPGSGKVSYTADVYLTSYEVESSVGDQVTFSAEFQVTGGVTRTVGT